MLSAENLSIHNTKSHDDEEIFDDDDGQNLGGATNCVICMLAMSYCAQWGKTFSVFSLEIIWCAVLLKA